MKPTSISYLITMGDSLSDRGTFYHRYLFGLIPVKNLLQHQPPKGRFTTGFVWSDYISAMIANELLIKELKEQFHWDSTDIADAVINHSFPAKHTLQEAYTLNNDQYVDFNGINIMRNYNEAGLMAHDYHWEPTSSPKSSIYRNLVSTLNSMREKLFAYDKAHGISLHHKEQTLVVEWSGANDLLIANEIPSKLHVDKAIEARIENVKLLIKQGYRHFVLFNLPDLLFTPRYQRRSEEERNNAHECSVYFNTKLSEACNELSSLCPECSIEEFDVNEIFSQGYNHPEKYGLDKEKITTPYAETENPSSKGYTFWDELHFTSYIHALVAEKFYNTVLKKYSFCKSESKEESRHVQPEATVASKATILVSLLASVAAIIGLNKLGVSAKTTAVGLGLATLGMFAKKPIANLLTQDEQRAITTCLTGG